MAKTSLKRTRAFIEMHNMEQDVQVDEYQDSDLEGIQYVVTHKQFGDPWKTEYFCRSITDAADCVNRIIYEIPMPDDLSPVKK